MVAQQNGSRASSLGPISLDNLKVAVRRVYNFSFRFTPTVSMSQQCYDIAGNAKPIKFSQLPDEFRQSYETSFRMYKSLQFDNGGVGRAAPPQ